MYVLKNKFYRTVIFLFDFIGIILTVPFRLFKKRLPKQIKKILVIRLDHIGDLLSATAVFHAVKDAYPNARSDVLVSRPNKDIVKNNPFIDNIMTYDAPWFNRKDRRLLKLKEFFRLAKALRKEKYDIGIDLRGDIRHIILMLLVGVRYKIGYGISGGGFLLDKEVSYRPGTHEVEHNSDILKSIGINSVYKKAELYIDGDSKNFAAEFYLNNNLTEQDFIVCIHAGAGYPSKRWLPKKWAQLINKLSEEFNAKVIFIGAEEDRTLADNIIRITKCKAIDAVGKTSLGELAALIKKARLFIGTDSGPSHIACAADTPSVILYSGTNDVKQWAPLNDKTIVLQKDIPCRGCEKLKCANNICMDLIAPEEVLNAVKQLRQK